MRYAIYHAQKEYVRIGCEYLKELQINVLLLLVNQEELSDDHYILNEILLVLPKMSVEQQKILALVYFIRFQNWEIFNITIFTTYLEKLNLSFENKPDFYYKRFPYTGCATINVLDGMDFFKAFFIRNHHLHLPPLKPIHLAHKKSFPYF